MKVSVSIPEWHQMAVNGCAPPVRILLHGNSMFPLIRMKRDYVTIVQLDQKLVKGDIVLFYSPQTGKYVVHRIWETRDGRVLTWGDHCSDPDPWILEDNVWGRVSLIERGRRQIKPNATKGLKWAGFWHKVGKVYRKLGKIWNGIIGR